MSVDWVSSAAGTSMSAAMASGDVQIAVSEGVPPFVIAASAGQTIRVVDVAVSHSENDNCVLRSDLGTTKDNADDLAGMKAAVPLGSAAQNGFLRQMDHLGVDISTIGVVDMHSPTGSTALAQGDVDFACGLATMKESGNLLLTGVEKEELGLMVVDVTSAPAGVIAGNPDICAVRQGHGGCERRLGRDPSDEMLQVIADESGQDLEAARAAISTFTFPTVEEQLSQTWPAATGRSSRRAWRTSSWRRARSSRAESYGDTVNTGPLMDASDM